MVLRKAYMVICRHTSSATPISAHHTYHRPRVSYIYILIAKSRVRDEDEFRPSMVVDTSHSFRPICHVENARIATHISELEEPFRTRELATCTLRVCYENFGNSEQPKKRKLVSCRCIFCTTVTFTTTTQPLTNTHKNLIRPRRTRAGGLKT